jgi:hypothetical protein
MHGTAWSGQLRNSLGFSNQLKTFHVPACLLDLPAAAAAAAAAGQVRIHDARSSDLYLRTRSHPIIEHSSGLRFAPFPIEQLAAQPQQTSSSQGSTQQTQQQGQGQEVPAGSNSDPQQQGSILQQQEQQHCDDVQQQLAEMLVDAQLSECSGMWQAVQDFGWVKASQSPHWALLPEQQRQQPQTLPGR